VTKHGVSIARACSLVQLPRATWYRQPTSSMERDRSVIEVLNEIVARKLRWGFRKLHDRLQGVEDVTAPALLVPDQWGGPWIPAVEAILLKRPIECGSHRSAVIPRG
jgi:hypothetical protein